MEQNYTYIYDGMNAFEKEVKRWLDFLLATVCLIIFSPLFVICYFTVKRGKDGPVIFKQERIGRFGRPFYIYKFRSMTIDAEANVAAYEALGRRTGLVGVYNWKTGEILCMVSTPTFDPADRLPDADDGEGYYFNNFLDGQITPGSTFKLVTSAAVIENKDDRDSYKFDCDGENEYNGTEFTDVRSHGEVNFRSALAQSCNGAFGELARELGAKTLQEYTEKAGLTEPVDVNGIKTAAGSFDFPADDNIKLSWAGIGQADDLVNPCAMMVFMGAIANEGEAIQPTLIKSATFLREITGGKSLGDISRRRLRQSSAA